MGPAQGTRVGGVHRLCTQVLGSCYDTALPSRTGGCSEPGVCGVAWGAGKMVGFLLRKVRGVWPVWANWPMVICSVSDSPGALDPGAARG